MTGSYFDIQVTSNFSFLEGASSAQELVASAVFLGHKAIAITDKNTLAGVVRMHVAAKEFGLRFLVGARLDFVDDFPSLLVFPENRQAYGKLCDLITTGRFRADKGQCELFSSDFWPAAMGFQTVVLFDPFTSNEHQLNAIASKLKGRSYLAISAAFDGLDQQRWKHLSALSNKHSIPLLVTNDILYHISDRRRLQDVLTCIRLGTTVDKTGLDLALNAERHLKNDAEMQSLFQDFPDALYRCQEILDACPFSLDELRYEYPEEITNEGRTPQEELTHLAWKGADWRYKGFVPDEIKANIRHELELIEQLDYAAYFLTVYDVVQFAEQEKILCQGRGSAANSTVCYCLGITSINPVNHSLLFERFISAERDEPPDIDVDFEHQRREEVIQYIYKKYGRDRAGIAATVVCYRRKGAIRDVGKALGLSEDKIRALTSPSRLMRSGDGAMVSEEDLIEAGLDPKDYRLQLLAELVEEIRGFPRHLSQHVGGFILSEGPLRELVPIENAAMKDRTVIQWDKDDLEALGLLKVDVLALGMLTCIKKCFTLLKKHYGVEHELASIPQDDKATYEMLQNADSMGVFQVESRAQMSMLPRLKPACFYDLVIEVAIVRPGPIQGDMVHPFLRRRDGLEERDHISEELKPVLERTMGVPIFQEQAMKIAIVAAGFTPSEADKLRRAMAPFKNKGHISEFRDKFVNGMINRGYPQGFAERCFKQLEGFGSYGFPESHAASFALLAYVSSWLKCHYPAVFCCALLNSQPMGFYAPAQLIRNAIEHDVEVRPADVNLSEWDSTLELTENGQALRLGLRQIRSLKEDQANKIINARDNGYADLYSLWHRSKANRRSLQSLAEADALGSIATTRRQAIWDIGSLPKDNLPLFTAMNESEIGTEKPIILPDPTLGEDVIEDYRTLTFSLKAHPCSVLRETLTQQGYRTCADLTSVKNGSWISLAGIVLVRQRPGTAKGVIFITIEDENSIANLVVWKKKFEEHRRELIPAILLGMHGEVQKVGKVIHVILHEAEDLSPYLHGLAQGQMPGRPKRYLKSRNFH